MFSRARQAQSAAYVAIPLAFMLAAGALYGIKGVSLVLSLLTVKETLMTLFSDLGLGQQYALYIMSMLAFILVLSQMLSEKPEFVIGNLPKVYSLTIFAAIVFAASLVPVEGLYIIYRAFASIILAPVALLLSKLATLPTAVASLGAIFVILLFVPLMTKIVTKLPYDMYLSGLVGSGFGVAITLLLTPLTVTAVRLLETYMASTGTSSEYSVFMLFLGLVLVAVAVNEAFRKLSHADFEYLMYMPGIVIMLIYAEKLLHIYSTYPSAVELMQLLDFTILAFVFFGVAVLYYSIFTKSKRLYTIANAYMSGILAALSTVPAVVKVVV